MFNEREKSQTQQLQELETLTETQEEQLREYLGHVFRKKYLQFQEFEKPSVLFQTNLVRNKGRYTIIFPYNKTNYALPYEYLDALFVDIFERSLENPETNPVNYRSYVTINEYSSDSPSSFNEYLGREMEAIESVYYLCSNHEIKKAIIQTTYLDLITGNPVAETWQGIIRKLPQDK
jgi:hypothetical protein